MCKEIASIPKQVINTEYENRIYVNSLFLRRDKGQKENNQGLGTPKQDLNIKRQGE